MPNLSHFVIARNRPLSLVWFIVAEILSVGCQSIPEPTSNAILRPPEAILESLAIEHRESPALPSSSSNNTASQVGMSEYPAARSEQGEYCDSSEPPSLLPPLLSNPELSTLGEEKLTLISKIVSDHRNYYSPESLTLLGGGFAVGSVMANTSIDRQIDKHFQSSIRNANSDDWFETFHSSKEMGNGKYTLPLFAGAWIVGELLPESRFTPSIGTWGERSLRGFLVGAPPLIGLQKLTGGSRPSETNSGSHWHPLTDNNGVSGHAFMGSLPFITAAKMSDSLAVKAGLYAASALTPISRVNDNAHYPSQVALGWWMAYLAASAVKATDRPDSRWRFYPYSAVNSTGITAEYEF